MVKRPRGSAALVSPCWRPGIWPVFEDQSCNFLCFLLFSVAFGRLGQMNKTKAIFKIILLYAHPFVPYFFIIKWAHVLMPLFHPTSTFCNTALFFFCVCAALLIPSVFLLSFLSSLPFFPSHLLLNAVLCISPSVSPSASLSLSSSPPYSVPPFPSALHSFVWSPFSYPQHIRCPRNERRESGRAKGRAWCRAQGIGFNEASLNEFTAFHWAALSHVADLHLSHCVRGPLSVLLPVCLTPL